MRWLLVLPFCCAAYAQSLPTALRALPVASGLGALTEVTSARDGSGRLFLIEQQGVIRILKDGAVSPTPFLDIRSRVLAGGERGLLSVAFPPGFASSGRFYVNYTDRPNGATVVAQYRVTSNPNSADPASERILFTVPQPYPNHNGGMTAFGPDGLLYVGMGDGGSGGDPQNNGQNPQSLLGKMLRLNPEGVPGPVQGDFVQISALGLRNPWRFSFDRESGDLWIGDVGQNKYEEIDFLPRASLDSRPNFGWRRMEGAHCYEAGCDPAGLTLPVAEYDHALGCSVTGGYVYRGLRWPELRGTYIYSDYCSGNTWVLRQVSNAFPSRLVSQLAPNITSFGEDEQGELYFATGDGTVFQVAGGDPMFNPAAAVNAASYRAGITPGSLATLFGTGITTVNGILNASALPLPPALAGTSVRVEGVEAPVLAVANVGGQEQINFQVPWEVAGRSSVSVVVRNNGVESSPSTVPLRTLPGLFAVTGSGREFSLWATGLGAVEVQPRTGEAGTASRLAGSVRVLVGGVDADVSYAGLAPGYVGLYQVNFRAPSSLPAGDADVRMIAGDASSNSLKVRLD